MEEQAKQRQTWWQKIKQHRVAIGVVATVLVVAIALIIAGYQFDWTGFNGYNKVTTTIEITSSPPKITRNEEYQPGKSLWDWLQLLGILAIPAVVGLGTVWFTTQQAKQSDANRERRHQTDLEIAEKNREREQQTALQITADNQHEAAFRAYLDKMSELLVEKKLGESATDDQVRKIARVQTLAVLLGLNGMRKRSVLQFLYESDLIDKDKTIVDLSGADLSEANLLNADLDRASLNRASLDRARLNRARLSGAELYKADLSEARLSGANLSEANLRLANLSFADLSEANLFSANLSEANLSGANLSFTNLSFTNLSFTDLSEARLSGAELYRADLSRANLKGAIGITIEELEKKAKSLQDTTMPDGSKHP